MSLLEDVFLEDEANEAHELERVIEGDEFDERPRSRSDGDDNSEREDEAVEEKKRVDPASTKSRRVIKNPRFTLNPARLTGPRGIQVIPEHFKDFKFKGKGHEKEDLDLVLKKLEHWAYRLYPKFTYEDCLKKIETLGKKRPVMVHLHKIRSDQYMSEETVVQRDSSEDETTAEPPPEDEFDKLLQQQIELARATPTPASVKKTANSVVKDNRSLMMPKATSSPSINDEQRERILRSRKLAEERRLARLKNTSSIINTSQTFEITASTLSKSDNPTYTQDKMGDSDENIKTKSPNRENDFDTIAAVTNSTSTHKELLRDDEISKVNSDNTDNVFNIDEIHTEKIRRIRRKVIDSSDEDEIVLMNESIRADFHKVNNDINHTKDKKGPKQTDGRKINDDVLFENDETTPIYEKDNGKSFDGNVITSMNKHNTTADGDSDKMHANGIQQGPKLTGHIINDVILEIVDNNHVGTEEVTLNNEEKIDKVNGSTTEIDNIMDKDSNDNVDKENGLAMIMENSTNNYEISNIHMDMTIDDKSPELTNSQEIKRNAGIEDNQRTIHGNEALVDIIPEKEVENNVEDLMDIEFDDDF